jgi:predicted dehydrogenase
MAADDTARIGIVGLGGMGRAHADAVEQLGHEVAAGADVVADARDSFGADYGTPTYEDFEEMYDAEELDGVAITTPNKFHAPAAVAAFERDVHVHSEKPLAHELEAAEEMVAAEADSDAHGMVGFQSRYRTGAKLFRAYDERDRFGDVRHVEVRRIRRRGIPGRGSWFTSRDLSGGGALIDIGVHSLDLVMHLLGFPEVVEVSGTTRSDFGAREDYVDPDGWGGHWDTDEDTFDVEDSASAFIRCANGTTISFEVAWAANRKPPEDHMNVWGTEAGATLSGGDLTVHGVSDAGLDHYVDEELGGSQDLSPAVQKEAEFVESALAGTRPSITFEQGLAIQRLMDAIYRSSETGEAVTPAE